MNIRIKDFSVKMDLGNNGIELEVRDPSDNHLGDLRIGKAKLEWCEGRTRPGKGSTKTWAQIIAFFDS